MEISSLKNVLTNRDNMINADKNMVARRTVLLFDRLQQRDKPEANVLALAIAFLLLCKRLKVEAQDAFTCAKNLMVDPMKAEGIDDRFAAISMHLEEDYR